jgi:hypothetical protein
MLHPAVKAVRGHAPDQSDRDIRLGSAPGVAPDELHHIAIDPEISVERLAKSMPKCSRSREDLGRFKARGRHEDKRCNGQVVVNGAYIIPNGFAMGASLWSHACKESETVVLSKPRERLSRHTPNPWAYSTPISRERT